MKSEGRVLVQVLELLKFSLIVASLKFTRLFHLDHFPWDDSAVVF